MDQFDLPWPKMNACFLTDGARCRIVWRSTGGSGPGGTIDNNELCKKRLADGLQLHPGLPEELRSRGYADLASEIEELAGEPAAAGGAGPDTDQVRQWLESLPGDGGWEETSARRGKGWVILETTDDRVLELRAPPARGKAEWVLKRSWPAQKRKAEFVAAASLKGIFTCLEAQDDGLEPERLTKLLDACKALEHDEVANALDRWKAGR